MPYISEDGRIKDISAYSGGQLNHDISILLGKFVTTNGLKYETLNTVVGACASALAEFQRRIVAPYEDFCIEKNGDLEVYERLLTELNKKKKEE